MIISTHGILASSGGAVDNASGYLFKSTTDSTVVNSVSNTITYSNLIAANTMLVGDFFQYNFRAIRSGVVGTCVARVYFNTSSSLTGATLVGTYSFASVIANISFTKISMIKSATNTELNAVSGSILQRDIQVNAVPIVANINWTVNQYFIIAFQASSALDSFYVNGLFFLKT